MAKKPSNDRHPNSKQLQTLLSKDTFRRVEGEIETYACGDAQARFPNADSNDWEVSVDAGKTWHAGMFPSGINLLRQHLDAKRNDQNVKA